MKLIFGVYVFLFCNVLFSQNLDNFKVKPILQWNQFDFKTFEYKFQKNSIFEIQDKKNSILFLEENFIDNKFV